jgi:hypothetical protein
MLPHLRGVIPMTLEAILATAYVVAAFGSFTGVVIWALRRAGPDFPATPDAVVRRDETTTVPMMPVKRAA